MKRALLLSALLGATTLSYAQQTKSPTRTVRETQVITVNQGPSIQYQYHDGVALLTDGTVLKGRFESNGQSTFTYRASSQARRQRIGASFIRRLALAGADTLVTDRRDSTIFIRLGHRLYRQLAGGATLVLDRWLIVDEARGKVAAKLFVLDDNGDFRRFTSLQKLNRWFDAHRERSRKPLPDVYRNEHEIIKAVAHLNGQ